MKIRDKKIGFTLAEVLFALLIVGVIAGMTIPSISKNIQNKMLATQAKKAYSSIQNAITQKITRGEGISSVANLLEIQNSPTDKIFHEDTKYKNLLKRDFELPKQNESNICTTGDGIAYGSIPISEGNCTMMIFFDVNGNQKPNVAGRDLFSVYVTNRGQLVDYGTCKKNDPTNTTNQFSDEDVLKMCTEGTHLSELTECTLLLERNNWNLSY